MYYYIAFLLFLVFYPSIINRYEAHKRKEASKLYRKAWDEWLASDEFSVKIENDSKQFFDGIREEWLAWLASDACDEWLASNANSCVRSNPLICHTSSDSLGM